MADAQRRHPRLWLAPTVAIGIAVFSWTLYSHAGSSVANAAFFPYAAILLLGPGVVYTCVRRGGETPRTALGFALAIPALWYAKEFYRLTGVFSVGEALYYALSPISLGVFGAAALQVALAELLELRRRSGRWQPARAPLLTLGVIAALGLGAAIVGHDSGGRDVFYGYIALYRILFPAG
jgi:hypothetical protein